MYNDKNGSQGDLFSLPEAPRPQAAGWITAHCDGGSRGNPGPAGFGVHIEDESGNLLKEIAEPLGIATNNFAEYSGLIAALHFAVTHGHPKLRVISDSELMVKQMKGQYRVKSPQLQPLYQEARRLAGALERFEIRHVLREKNRRADTLANQAMDRSRNEKKGSRIEKKGPGFRDQGPGS